MSQENKPKMTLQKLKTSIEEKPFLKNHFFDNMSHELDLLVARLEGQNIALKDSIPFQLETNPHEARATQNWLESNKKLIQQIQELK